MPDDDLYQYNEAPIDRVDRRIDQTNDQLQDLVARLGDLQGELTAIAQSPVLDRRMNEVEQLMDQFGARLRTVEEHVEELTRRAKARR